MRWLPPTHSFVPRNARVPANINEAPNAGVVFDHDGRVVLHRTDTRRCGKDADEIAHIGGVRGLHDPITAHDQQQGDEDLIV